MTEDQLKIGLKVRMAMSWKRDVCRSTNKTTKRLLDITQIERDRLSHTLQQVVWGEGGYADPRYHYAQELDVVPE